MQQPDEDEFLVSKLVLFNEQKQSALLSNPEAPLPSQAQLEALMEDFIAHNALLACTEEKNRGRASCKLWHDLHNGRITSSRLVKCSIDRLLHVLTG